MPHEPLSSRRNRARAVAVDDFEPQMGGFALWVSQT
jgi:hypothetical protein